MTHAQTHNHKHTHIKTHNDKYTHNETYMHYTHNDIHYTQTHTNILKNTMTYTKNVFEIKFHI